MQQGDPFDENNAVVQQSAAFNIRACVRVGIVSSGAQLGNALGENNAFVQQDAASDIRTGVHHGTVDIAF
eukprot:7273548-Alexandrium_andersonii.AAC.1